VAQHEVALHLRPAQVEEAVLEADLLADLGVGVDLEGWRLGLVEHGQGADEDLDFPAGQVEVAVLLAARAHCPGDLDDPFRAQAVGLLLDLRRADVGVEDHLGQAVAVAQVDEDDAAMVAVVLHPAAERDRLSEVRGPKLATGMGASHGGSEGVGMLRRGQAAAIG